METVALALAILLFMGSCRRLIWLYRDRVHPTNAELAATRWHQERLHPKDPGVLVPRPFLRPVLKKLDQVFEGVALMVLKQATRELVEAELAEAERVADLALYHVDPSLAAELGYEVPEHVCRWSRAYRSSEPPGPFTCHVCGRPWEDPNLKRRRERWRLPT